MENYDFYGDQYSDLKGAKYENQKNRKYAALDRNGGRNYERLQWQ